MKEYFWTSERIGFSTWVKSDINDALELWGNPNVTKYIALDGKMNKQQVEDRLTKEIEMHNKAKVQYWPIYLIKSNQHIGCCGLRPYDTDKNIYELGVHLKEAYWRKGYASEACSAVIDYAFNTLGIDYLFAGHNPNNTASAEMLKKLGFRYTHDEFYQPTGLMHPSYLMSKV